MTTFPVKSGILVWAIVTFGYFGSGCKPRLGESETRASSAQATGANQGQSRRLLGKVGVKAISGNESFACALLSQDKGMRCWGLDQFQQMGAMPSLTEQIQEIAANSRFSCALTADTHGSKNVFCWGINYHDVQSKVPSLKNPTQVAVSDQQGCAATDDGIKCWGRSNSAPWQSPPSNAIGKVVSLKGGSDNFCAIVGDNQGQNRKVLCWGGGSMTNEPLNQKVPSNLHNPVKIAVGLSSACVVDEEAPQKNVIKCWGEFMPNVGNDVFSEVRDIHDHGDVCVLLQDSVKCWAVNPKDNMLSKVGKLSDPKQILIAQPAAGVRQQVCIVTQDAVECWGPKANGHDMASIPDDIQHIELLTPEMSVLSDNGKQINPNPPHDYTKNQTAAPAAALADRMASQSVLKAMEDVRESFQQAVPSDSKIKSNLQVSENTVRDCLTNVAAHWSDITLHYYCQLGAPRACYSGAIGAKKPREEAWKGCSSGDANFSGSSEFKWVVDHQPQVFRYLMMSETFAFHLKDQNDVINAFYGRMKPLAAGPFDPNDVFDCNAYRPRRVLDPTDGTHCRLDKVMKPPMRADGK